MAVWPQRPHAQEYEVAGAQELDDQVGRGCSGRHGPASGAQQHDHRGQTEPERRATFVGGHAGERRAETGERGGRASTRALPTAKVNVKGGSVAFG
ncbi:hypothetical protein AB0D04_11695 [Streptomyces sp. NPDC048483]|uniref:hypothetical protein n=1 Tax=Streptomyces sp. NPDC048483 TaxID=3154927 RepID=UPI0034361DE1